MLACILYSVAFDVYSRYCGINFFLKRLCSETCFVLSGLLQPKRQVIVGYRKITGRLRRTKIEKCHQFYQFFFNISLISTARAPFPSSKTIMGLISNSSISGKSQTSFETLKMVSTRASISESFAPRTP